MHAYSALCEVDEAKLHNHSEVFPLVHKTKTGEKRKILKQKAKKAESTLKYLEKLDGIDEMGDHSLLKATLASRLDSLRAEERALVESFQARIEDTTVFCREFTKPSGRVYKAWYVDWRVGGKNRSQYLSACSKMTQEEALEKARRLKLESLKGPQIQFDDKYKVQRIRFKDRWWTPSKIGELFGISSRAVDRVLVQCGLQKDQQANEKALKEEYATTTHLRNGTPFYLWDVSRVFEIVAEKHKPLTEVERYAYGVRKRQIKLERLYKSRSVLDREAADIMLGRLYDEVPSRIEKEVRDLVESQKTQAGGPKTALNLTRRKGEDGAGSPRSLGRGKSRVRTICPKEKNSKTNG